MPTGKKKRWSRRVLAVAVLVLLVLLSAANAKMATQPLERLCQREITFAEYVDEVQKGYLSNDFAHKDDFLGLGGLFNRLAGRRMLNGIVKLSNGMLSAPVEALDPAPAAGGITELSDYLRGQDIRFLYVQAPYKESLDGRSFPVGVDSYANQNADALLALLEAGGVETLDLRPQLSQTPQLLERYFYKTDHHWSADGAFVAFGELLGRLDAMFPQGGVDVSYAHPDRWQRHSIDDWFLGSRGRAVGIDFGGVDPLIWYTPGFETEMSCAVLSHGWLYRGDFEAANIRSKYIEEKHYYDDSAYCVYIGGDYPLVRHSNANAPSPLRVLMLKDSFTLPLQAYMSTVFQEVDVIDPRFFTDCGAAEYAARTRPDVVILTINPDVIGDASYHQFGVEAAARYPGAGAATEVVTRQDMTVEASESNYNYLSYPLQSGTTYRLTFDRVDVLKGQTGSVGLRLYDATTQDILSSMMFDMAYCEATGGYTWTFRTPDTQDDLRLLLYAGVYEVTAGNGVVYRNVTLERYAQ